MSFTIPRSKLEGVNRLRILHATPHFPWFGETSVVGGSANILFNLAKEQAKEHSVSILSYIPETACATTTDAGVRLIPLSRSGDPGTIRFGISSVLNSARWIQANHANYDLIHVHSGFLDYALIPALSALATTKPTTYTLYCPIPLTWGRWNQPVYKALLQRGLRGLPLVTMISHNIESTLREYLGDGAKTRVILPGVDLARFHPGPASSELRAKLELEEDSFVVLFVGNHKPAKNLISVLRAFAQLRQRFSHVRLIITTELKRRSEDAYAAMLSDEITRLGIGEDIRQLGIVDDMPDLMRLSDVLLAPFLDTFGPSDYFMAALEALACGKPVICSHVGGMPEVVTPDIGYLIDPRSLDELTAAMTELVLDSARCTQMGLRGAQLAHERFHPGKLAHEYDELYQDLYRKLRESRRQERGQMLTNQAFYDSDAATYDERWNSNGGRQTDQTQRQIVRELCQDWRDRSVLEIGSGTGRFSLELAKLGAKLTLADLSGSMLGSVRGKLGDNGFDPSAVKYVQSNIYALGFPDESFDRVISLNVLSHIDDIRRAMRECARVLRPGGQFLLNYPNLSSYYWPAAHYINRTKSAIGQPVFSKWYTAEVLERAMQEAGLKVISRVGHVHAPRGMGAESIGIMRKAVSFTDSISRDGPLRKLAPVQFCLCVKE